MEIPLQGEWRDSNVLLVLRFFSLRINVRYEWRFVAFSPVTIVDTAARRPGRTVF